MSSITLTWRKEQTPRWDADKDTLFGDEELAGVGMTRPADGAALADEWWRVEDGDGTVLGYGWLDSQWGDAHITFVVSPAARGQGIGGFILNRLEHAARTRGLNHIYNRIPDSHPDRDFMAAWLAHNGFTENRNGELHRQVGGMKMLTATAQT